MSLHSGERQVSTSLEAIRKDHTARYKFVCERETNTTVLDCGCGIGYGSKMLVDSKNVVSALDIDQETVDFAYKNYPGPTYEQIDLNEEFVIEGFQVGVAFEVIEHLDNPENLLRALKHCEKLYASVPNQEVFPWQESFLPFHKRHYTKKEFEILLNTTGWQVLEWLGQEGTESTPETDVNGRTLIAVCERRKDETRQVKLKYYDEKPEVESVAILGLGPSLSEFIDFSKRAGGASAFVDEVWGINAVGNVVHCDRIFHMDDVRIQEIRAKAKPESNIANMLKWLKRHPGPIYTSRPHNQYKGLVAMPIEAMIRELTFDYFNSTAAWAVAYAVYIGVKHIKLYGCDFTYPNAHHAEKGRACVEFWLGIAVAKGIRITFPTTTTIMDACEPRHERLYGYDTVDVLLDNTVSPISIKFYEKDALPTAEQVEAKYNHSRHPNQYVEKGQA